jgi:predicted permease
MWRRRQTDEDFRDELDAHLEHEADRLMGEGRSAEEARAEARRQFGNVTRARERYHESGRLIWLEQFARDIGYAWRGLRRSPAFAATTVLTLAVGLGIVTVVFAAFSAYVLRPFAVRDPYSLYLLSWRAQEAGGRQWQWRDYESLRQHRKVFDSVIATTRRPMMTNGQSVYVGFVTGNYFDALGPHIALGRGLVPGDALTPGGDPVAVLTDRAWTKLFERDPAVLGREVVLNGHRFVVVGIAAPGFEGIAEVPEDLWVPLTMHDVVTAGNLLAPDSRGLVLTVRLARGIRPEQVPGAIPLEPFETRVKGRIDPVRAVLTPQATPAPLTLAGVALLSPIFAAFGLVLVAACANASNVMLARANARHREIGIRLSIGASRARIVRQLVTEGLLIAVVAGAVGLVLARVLLSVALYAVLSLLPTAIALRVALVPFDFDYRVFLFSFLVAGATTLIFALVPALQATRLTLTDALRGQVTAVFRGTTLRRLLITGQVAVSLLLLIIAATFIRNGAAIRSADFGLDPHGVVSVRTQRGGQPMLRRAYDTLAGDARVAEVAVTNRNPLFGDTMTVPVRHGARLLMASYSFVSPNYFSAVNVPVLRGRGFTTEEATQEATVGIISASGAAIFWPGEDPIGKSIRLQIEPADQKRVGETVEILKAPCAPPQVCPDVPLGNTEVTIVGVAKDAVNGFVYEGAMRPHVYLPTSVTGVRAQAILVKGKAGQLAAETIRPVLQPLSPDLLTFDVLAMTDMIDIQMFPLRAASWIGSLLSGIALALSISGLYGVLTYTFGQRVQEIGIRMALGADARAITRLVITQSARFAALGTIIGLLLAFAIVKVLSTLIRLDNVSVIDPGAFIAGIVLTIVAVAIASYGPTRRALRIDPSSMLRADA